MELPIKIIPFPYQLKTTLLESKSQNIFFFNSDILV